MPTFTGQWEIDSLSVICPKCNSKPSEVCKGPTGKDANTHRVRQDKLFEEYPEARKIVGMKMHIGSATYINFELRNYLHAHGLHTLEDLTKCKASDLLRFYSLDWKRNIDRLSNALKEWDLSLIEDVLSDIPLAITDTVGFRTDC